MKYTFVNTLLLVLSLTSPSGAKERLFQEEDGARTESQAQISDDLDEKNPHFFSPIEMEISSSASNDELGIGDEGEQITSRTVFQGRTEPSPECGEGISRHYELPCDDNVVSKTTDNSEDPISGRNPPSDSNCVTTDGTFGDISDSAALLTVPLDYFYEMKVVAGTSQSTINDEILPPLEKAIVDSILQEVYPDKCISTAVGKRHLRENRSKRHLEVIGVSMYPPDYVTANTCEQMNSKNPPGDCYVVKGELTIFTQEEHVAEEQARIENLIKEHMNDGVFNTASDEIIQLYYLNGAPGTSESNINDNEKINGAEGSKKGSNKALTVGLVVGLGALVALIAGVTLRVTRRMRNADDDTEIQTSPRDACDVQTCNRQTYLDVDDRPSID